MDPVEIVLDTNVVYAALRSQLGVSHQLLNLVGVDPRIRIHLSVPLVLEYEEIAKRNARSIGLNYQDIDDLLDYLCSVAGLHAVFYMWRPFLTDPDDDMLLELAVEAGCSRIVTFNVRDFKGVEQFGIHAITPRQLLREIGVMQ